PHSVGRSDHFFDRGGTSLSAVKLTIALDRAAAARALAGTPAGPGRGAWPGLAAAGVPVVVLGAARLVTSAQRLDVELHRLVRGRAGARHASGRGPVVTGSAAPLRAAFPLPFLGHDCVSLRTSWCSRAG
ncbi:hypothetical protein, partial [Streptomyces sp. NPDC003374]